MTAIQPITAARTLDVARIRQDFPILSRPVRGKRLVFLDSAASAQKPRSVTEAERDIYETGYANVHRGVYWLSQRATGEFEAVREKVRRLLNARETREIVFVRGATEAINLVAQSFGRAFLSAGDEVLISHMEHHSNIVPWQMLREYKGVVLKVAPIDDAGELDLEAFEKLIGPRTKLIAVTHVANALGTVVPIEQVIRLAKGHGIPVLVDGCQAVPHQAVDVQALDCDFYVFSGHKLYGPTGIGVLYGKAELLQAMPPWQGGGDMIRSVSFERTEYNELPWKFEAGTPHIIGAIGLGAAIDYVQSIGYDAIAAHEADLLACALRELSKINSLRIIGQPRHRSGVISFALGDVHPHDIATILDQDGVCVRAGHHCAQPTMDRFGVSATARASFGIYNDRDDIDSLVAGLRKVQEVFRL
ncbi:MAG TPA: cysteine desulfurase [Dongiaceae bacterium]|jgi:cysteine desulfurase/selenocysteine lyase|nr:cysteine desulfurase [Dongiaceae bacterium]